MPYNTYENKNVNFEIIWHNINYSLEYTQYLIILILFVKIIVQIIFFIIIIRVID